MFGNIYCSISWTKRQNNNINDKFDKRATTESKHTFALLF
jgi:hypothetical protein